MFLKLLPMQAMTRTFVQRIGHAKRIRGTGYQWSSGDNTISTTVSPLTNTEYYVTVTGVNLCTDVDTVMVYVHQLPPANAGDDEDICFGDDVTLTATGGTTYNWNTGDNTDNITVSPGTDTEYIVTVEDAWGCLDSDTVNVNVNPLPDAQAGEDQDICLGETATLTASNGNNYHWNTGDDLQSIQVSPGTSTEYIVTVTDGNLCSDTDTVTVNVFEVVANAGDNQDICAGESVTLNASGGTGYQWSSGGQYRINNRFTTGRYRILRDGYRRKSLYGYRYGYGICTPVTSGQCRR